MNSLIITLVVLLGLMSVADSITCYYCIGCAANAALTSDGVTTYTACGTYFANGLWTRGGDSTGASCTTLTAAYTLAGGTNTHCCTTNLCNGAEAKRVSLFLAIGIAIFSVVGFL